MTLDRSQNDALLIASPALAVASSNKNQQVQLDQLYAYRQTTGEAEQRQNADSVSLSATASALSAALSSTQAQPKSWASNHTSARLEALRHAMHNGNLVVNTQILATAMLHDEDPHA